MKLLRLIPVFLGLVVAVATLAARGGVAREDPLVTGPDKWVAFEADFVNTYGDAVQMTGKVYRASDGSYRRHGTDAKGRYTVTIHNISRNLAYNLELTDTAWTSRPMKLPPEGYKPPRGYRASRIVTSPEVIDGYKLVQLAAPPNRTDSMRTLMAPDLNFQLMVFEFDSGAREALKNVTLREPEPNLFLPPADAFVTFINEPGGLVAKPARGR